MIQYDAVNAFVHARLDEIVYMRMPPGYEEKGFVLLLQKALYELRKSPLLWHQCFKIKLESLGYQTVSHEPCCMIKDGVIISFYVDDIAILYRKEKQCIVTTTVINLQQSFNLTGGNPLR